MKSFIGVCNVVLLLGSSFVHGGTPAIGPQTLLQIAEVKLEPSHLSGSVLIIVDAQREYVDGKLRLDGIDTSLKEASLLLERARKSGTPIIHVVHKGKPGGALFNPDGPYVEIAGPVAPRADETIVTKTLPNAFSGTTLEETLSRLGRKNLIVIGYMTHMCVSSTVRAAVDHGYHTTVVAKATATRSLPSPEGENISAQTLQRATLAALADRFAVVVQNAKDIPE
ncbi:MAG TPA: cysteine hydrolase family protein [Kiritimatiellia bacterium]|nr:cysteine hydrolase family protein [Kiritimatiellia bacterium]